MTVKNNLLIEQRESLGLSQKQAGELCGVGYATVGGYETLRIPPQLTGGPRAGDWKDTAKRIAHGYGVNIEDLWPLSLVDAQSNMATNRITAHVDAVRMVPISDALGVPTVLASRIVDEQFAAETLSDLLKTIGHREREILRMRFGLEGRRQFALDEIADRYDVPRERVLAVEAIAIRKLRARLKGRDMLDFIVDV
ncbi:MAG: helix-turn-helix domain-containing protein [Planctomycetes bacterium]|nr:helix-turn-helix domain-containing protein [Planctomycetota bacterium]